MMFPSSRQEFGLPVGLTVLSQELTWVCFFLGIQNGGLPLGFPKETALKKLDEPHHPPCQVPC